MIIIVQLLPFLAVVVGTPTLMRGAGNARHQAVRRILLTLFALAAALSVFFPALLTRLANVLGIGRGTDLVLYALIVFFMLYMATSSQRTRQLETRITKLARRIAPDEAPRPEEAAARRDSRAEGGTVPSPQGDGTDRRAGGIVPSARSASVAGPVGGQLPGTAGRKVQPGSGAGRDRGSSRRPERAGG
ncbi:DUF2304 domain-containing protein [Arthrobacter deserti]|uniref:DUF2304 domain-containing protein n=1 Tax=Arthrobacter deserti TaxID=1742687 RepID=A0ABX1JK01_9MICC|nr:DUF2304 domain-containing protein [Arthrobacter deserti]